MLFVKKMKNQGCHGSKVKMLELKTCVCCLVTIVKKSLV